MPEPTPTRYAREGDLHIAWRTLGDGPVDLLWVPNWIFSVDLVFDEPRWSRFFERLAGFSRLILFDRRGSGASDPVVGAPTLEERMDDLRIVLDAAGSERAVILGVSEAAAMSALFAASRPDRTRALVLWGALPRTFPLHPGDPLGASPQARSRRVIEDWGTGRNLRIFAPSLAGDTRFVEWWSRLERLAASPGRTLAILRLNARVDVTHVLGAISVPTLVIHRRGDRVAPIANARHLAEAIPGARLLELEGDDHIGVAGDFEPVVEEIEELVTGSRSAREAERVLATVLFTDIVDSTGRAAALGDRRWRDLLAEHDERLRNEIERHRGRAVKSTGDGVLAVFDGPARAIRCGLAAHEAVRDLGLRLRVGLHTGECEMLGDDVGGVAVHIGARVTEAAAPGEVLASGTVRDLVVGSGIAFEPRGERELRGVPGTWALYAVSGARVG
ncbi:MAG: adenylate/guanylate cyclase domain-containing protein [Solirubrobacteraceae bacterium]